MNELEAIRADLQKSLDEFFEIVKPKRGQLIVVGCSTSEVIGKRIGTAGSEDIGECILEVLRDKASQMGVYIAVQCCEHLNRALVVEEDFAGKEKLEVVSVYPVAKAGGALAAAAMKKFAKPTVVESIIAHGGIDIGSTLIGMHIKRVAIPVKLSYNKVGQAIVTAAWHRPKLIGGDRAVYQPCFGK